MKVLKIGNEDVEIDEKILNVTPENINEFLSKYAAWHRFYQTKHNDASYIAKCYNDQYNKILNQKFRAYKQEGNLSDKMAEASAKSDEEVLAAQEKLRQAEYIKDELFGFLKSMDYSHENSLQICYNIRKEIDKISGSYVKKV